MESFLNPYSALIATFNKASPPSPRAPDSTTQEDLDDPQYFPDDDLLLWANAQFTFDNPSPDTGIQQNNENDKDDKDEKTLKMDPSQQQQQTQQQQQQRQSQQVLQQHHLYQQQQQQQQYVPQHQQQLFQQSQMTHNLLLQQQQQQQQPRQGIQHQQTEMQRQLQHFDAIHRYLDAAAEVDPRTSLSVVERARQRNPIPPISPQGLGGSAQQQQHHQGLYGSRLQPAFGQSTVHSNDTPMDDPPVQHHQQQPQQQQQQQHLPQVRYKQLPGSIGVVAIPGPLNPTAARLLRQPFNAPSQYQQQHQQQQQQSLYPMSVSLPSPITLNSFQPTGPTTPLATPHTDPFNRSRSGSYKNTSISDHDPIRHLSSLTLSPSALSLNDNNPNLFRQDSSSTAMNANINPGLMTPHEEKLHQLESELDAYQYALAVEYNHHSNHQQQQYQGEEDEDEDETPSTPPSHRRSRANTLDPGGTTPSSNGGSPSLSPTSSSSLVDPHHPNPSSKDDHPETETLAQQLAEEDKRRRNTAASARFRNKKRLREQILERTAKEMTVKSDLLEVRVKELEMEIKWLRGLIVEKDSARVFGNREEQDLLGDESSLLATAVVTTTTTTTTSNSTNLPSLHHGFLNPEITTTTAAAIMDGAGSLSSLSKPTTLLGKRGKK